MSESELAELKSVLRSLVVSSPTKVDVRTILKDYRSLVGGPLPHVKFGYRDPVAFFKERCGDCFLMQGMPANPVLTLIVPETLKHIDKFVQSQKASPTTKLKGKRTSIPEPFVRRQNNENLIVKTFKDKTVEKRDNAAAHTTVTSPNIGTLSITDKSHREHENKPQTSYSKENANNNTNDNGENTCTSTEGPSTALQAFLKKKLPQYRSQNMHGENDKSSGYNSSPIDTDSGRFTSSSDNSSKQAQLEDLKREIHQIIKDAPEGIWCMELMRLYRARYGRDLNFTRFGFMTIVSLVKSMGSRVRVTRPSEHGDWRLADAGAPRPAAPRPARPADAGAPRPAAPRPAPRRPPLDPDDALPGIDFDPAVFPADCLHFVESVPAAQWADVRPGAMLEVVVGEVYSPSHFWLMRLGDAHHNAMEDIMDDMTAYFSSEEGRSRFLARGAVRVGQYCAALYDGDWHRALIVALLDDDRVKVRHVDYGTVDEAAAGALRPLRREWARLPAQALRARLAALRPAAGTRRWTHRAALHFLSLVKDRRLVANVVAVDPAEEWFETFLVDTSGEEDVCLSREMIRAGHADPRADSVLAADEAYLYPAFAALEAGATPNLADIDRYLRAGVALEYVDSYRRHVPTALPAPASPPPPSPPPPPPPEPSPSSPSPPHTQIPLLLPMADETPPAPASAPDSAPPPAPVPAAAPSPAPAPEVAPEAGSIRLSAAEVQIYEMLCAMDPVAAQCYMSAAMQRARRSARPHSAAPQSAPPQPTPPVFAPPQPTPPVFAPPQPTPPVFAPPQPTPPVFAPPHIAPPQYAPPHFPSQQFGPPHIGPPQFYPPQFGPPQFGPPPFGSPPRFHPLPFGPPPGF